MQRVAIVAKITIDDVALDDWKTGRPSMLTCFVSALLMRGFARDRVEVVIGERFLRHRGPDGNCSCDGVVSQCPQLALHAVQVPATSCSCAFLNDVPLPLVTVTHPSMSAALVVASDRQHVIGNPRETPREVRGFDTVSGAAVVLERPDERRCEKRLPAARGSGCDWSACL
jgi:hypothetical protein